MRKVVAIDFDGTLTTIDCFLPFLLMKGHFKLSKCLKEVLLYPFKRDRKRLKESMMKAVFEGVPYAEVLSQGEQFYKSYVVHHLRKSMMKRLEEHRREGATLVLVSANVNPILLPVQRELGFDALLCSELEVDDENRLTGNLSTPNCRGEEKVRRLENYLKGERVFLEAYGDSSGDKEMMARADLGHSVTSSSIS